MSLDFIKTNIAIIIKKIRSFIIITIIIIIKLLR